MSFSYGVYAQCFQVLCPNSGSVLVKKKKNSPLLLSFSITAHQAFTRGYIHWQKDLPYQKGNKKRKRKEREEYINTTVKTTLFKSQLIKIVQAASVNEKNTGTLV